MLDETLTRLIEGYKMFHAHYSGKEYDAYRKTAAVGQTPRVMFISCSDSRVNPAIVTQSGLGDIFLVCNVANIVPPYRPMKGSHHSTSSALEFAVCTLGVEHIIVMGHSGCGGIQALLSDQPTGTDDYSFIKPWVEIIADARTKVAHHPKHEQHHHCEQEALKISLANLDTFPWIADRCAQGNLSTHAWHFDIPSGLLSTYDRTQKIFVPLA